MDTAIVMDSSSSITESNWDVGKDLIKVILKYKTNFFNFVCYACSGLEFLKWEKIKADTPSTGITKR